MNTTNHTPGPWEIIGSNVYSRNGWKDTPIASPCINSGIEQSKANANLIASAPDLLEALRFLLADYIAIQGDKLTGSSVPIEMAQAAILKAEGNK